jgi:SMC interacting uncharacterized protein involved in chromosome segregation
MTGVVQKALEEAVQSRDEEIDELKCKLSRARNALYSAIVFVNNECQGLNRQNEMYDHLNEAYKDSQ